MAELIVVGFKGTQRAAEVLEQVRALELNWVIELEDAVAVYRTQKGKLRVDQSVQPTEKEGAAWGALLGAMLGGIFAAPFTAGASVPAAAAAVAAGGVTIGATIGGVLGGTDALEWKEQYGISEQFVKDVGGMIQPGQSAVFVLTRTFSPDDVAERFKGYGGKVLRTTLSKEAAKKLQAAFNAGQMVTA